MISFTIKRFCTSSVFTHFKSLLNIRQLFFLQSYLFIGVVTMADLISSPPQSFETGLDAKVLTGKMPSTRSQAQPILQFPRRKSSGVHSKSTPSKSTSQLKEPQSFCSVGASKPQSLPERAQLTPLSHGPVALKGITLCPRIPLSPRKRTGMGLLLYTTLKVFHCLKL